MAGERVDPFGSFNFYVSLVDSTSTLAKLTLGVQSAIDLQAVAGFTECSGLEGTLVVEDYNEGGVNGFVHKFPTRMTYGNITLKRGMTQSAALWQWHADYAAGKGKRRDGVIILRDEEAKAVRTWTFHRGMPLKWQGPSLNAAQGQIAIETLEIVHEGLTTGSPGGAITEAARAIASLF